MNTNNSYESKICKLHEKDTKYTRDSENKKMTFFYGNRVTINKETVHGCTLNDGNRYLTAIILGKRIPECGHEVGRDVAYSEKC